MKPTSANPTFEALASITLPDIVRPDLLARHLGCRTETVRGYLRAGFIPGRKVGARWLIPRRELLRALAEPAASRLRVLPGAGGDQP